MYQLTPTGPNVIDAMTGKAMPPQGVQRGVLLPPDHYAQRTGDVTITEIQAEATPGEQADNAAAAEPSAAAPAKTSIKR